VKVAPSASAIVVGAGIVGAACALYLSREGFAVSVLDAAFPASGATAAGMGHLVAMDDSEAQFALCAYSISLWASLREELGPVGEMDNCGTLWIAEDDEELEAVRVKHEFYGARGVASEILDSAETARLEPILRPLAGSLKVPTDSVVYPPGAALAILDAAARGSGGTKVHAGWSVNKMSENEVRGPRGMLAADVIINATGNDAPALTPDVQIKPRRGHLVITDRYPGALSHQIVELGYLKSAHEMTSESVAFNVQPRATGQLLIGSSRELGQRSGGVNTQILGRMLARAQHFIPSLGSLSATRVWTGSRPTTADKLPLIGRSPQANSGWIAAGHEGLGITTSLATGKLIAHLVAGRQTGIDASPFDPSRPSAVWP
jgi:glycine/D-amino acid oxidase-like deaminating enzyme